ncbi:alpha/beta hydrolase domain-containing protein [Planctomycetota bacterium]
MLLSKLHRTSRIEANKVIQLFLCVIVCLLVLLPQELLGKVVRVEIEVRELYEDGQNFGGVGQYEKIAGKMYLEVDPDDPANQRVVDLKLADRNERGNVEFWTDFELLKPVDALKGNRRLLYFVNNRGWKVSLYFIDSDGGNNWLFRQGYSILWCGWNGDATPGEEKMNMGLPIAHENGQTITGKIYAEICTTETGPGYSKPFYWGSSVCYPVVSLDNSHATLSMRPSRSAEPIELPRDQWAFARWDDGKVIEDAQHLYVKEGFRPGWLYDLVYVGKDPRVTGLGFAAVRDVVSFFRYEQADHDNKPNPIASVIEHAYAYGISQSGRFIYHFIYEDFNGDEKSRMVFDGVVPHVGGAGKGQFNYRFAQTTRHGSPHEDNLFPSDFFPFTTVEQYDPITGQRGDALARPRKSGFLPKIFFSMTSTEYWTRAASLLHTDVQGKRDIEFDPNVRLYLHSCREHNDDPDGPLMRSQFVLMDEWVTHGIEPPPSNNPKISDGTLVDVATYHKLFPSIPGVQVPESCFMPYRLDPGPRWHTEGIADNVPPKVGKRYTNLVPAVDSDGNELAGIRLPDIAVPLGTYVGWKVRSPDHPAAGTLERVSGSHWPFARTAEERKKNGDSRPSILERYPKRAEYLAKVTDAVLKLKAQRFLLEEDAVHLLQKAAGEQYWDNQDD